MKKTFIITHLLLLIIIQNVFSQKRPTFDHTTVYVTDLDKSVDFYERVMMLEKIAEPFHDNRHAWMKIGEHNQLHIVQGAAAIVPHDINIHLAFTFASIENFSRHLDSMNVKYGNWKQDSKAPQVRPDGVKQIYFQDPDGFWIEVNNDTY
jgi:lactoylglutathione lyase